MLSDGRLVRGFVLLAQHNKGAEAGVFCEARRLIVHGGCGWIVDGGTSA